MKKSFGFVAMVTTLFLLICFFTSCKTGEIAQYGLEEEDTIALNLTKDPNVGYLFVTHVNGELTGAYVNKDMLSILTGTISDYKYVNPLYIELNGKPITFTILCPVVVGHDSAGKPNVQYKSTELRLTKLSDLKAGDVLTLKWMYQTQTFAFIDATGNLVQQIIPTFD